MDYDGDLFNAYYFDIEQQSSWESVDETILDNIKPCLCGGGFQRKARSKCPFCFSEIDENTFLAYSFASTLPDQAFATRELREDYERLLKERTEGNKLYYKYGLELAIDFARKGYLNHPSDDQKKELRRSLPFHTAFGVLASQWLIPKPKRKLFELYMKKFFAPAHADRQFFHVMHQYNIAHAISVLAGKPFKKENIRFEHFNSTELQNFIAKNQEQFSELMERFKNKNLECCIEKANELNLSEWAKKYDEFISRNKNEVEIPFMLKAQKEICRWRNWWQANKEKLPA
jgi:hypothetical protein